ncbi:MAG: HEAT repeat domain-containing protein [Sedimentisphaerales bacterium]|nr:HEAT repeat domain-containing protein [Sedimentisphaerales bacterium]
MSTNNLKTASIAAAAAGVVAQTADFARAQGADELLAGIKSNSAEKRTQAGFSAGKVGAPAVKALAKVMTDDNLEVARAAKRAMWQIVRYTGRPGTNEERRAVETELIDLLGDEQLVAVRREVLWMLSEIGSRRSIDPIAGLMKNENLREDARMVLERIPNRRAVAALKAAFEAAPEDFKPNIAQSLRKRGEEVAGYPCRKLVPKKKTDVKPL